MSELLFDTGDRVSVRRESCGGVDVLELQINGDKIKIQSLKTAELVVKGIASAIAKARHPERDPHD